MGQNNLCDLTEGREMELRPYVKNFSHVFEEGVEKWRVPPTGIEEPRTHLGGEVIDGPTLFATVGFQFGMPLRPHDEHESDQADTEWPVPNPMFEFNVAADVSPNESVVNALCVLYRWLDYAPDATEAEVYSLCGDRHDEFRRTLKPDLYENLDEPTISDSGEKIDEDTL